MIAVESVSKAYDSHSVVSNVSFTVAAGETLVLLGTSGSGKTTLLRMINRLVKPTVGTIRLDNKDVSQVKPEELRRKIGYVIQQSGLFPHYSVEQNIELVPTLLGWSHSRTKQRVRELLEVVGLEPQYAKRYPHELSGGQQQRVGIARALAADPPVILMDEPFGALDPITKQQMAHEFASWGVLQEKTIVMVTHDVLEAFALGDHICLLDQGRIQQEGTPKELLFRPKNEFVHSFFRTQQLRLGLEVVRLKDIMGLHQPSTVDDRQEGHISRIAESASVFEALDRLEEGKSRLIVEREGGTNVAVDRYQLLRYFLDAQHE